MDTKHTFDIQWYGIQDAVLAEAYRQLHSVGKLDMERLTDKLHYETGKWKGRILAQGIFYQQLVNMDKAKAQQFADAAMHLRFEEPHHNQIPSLRWITMIEVLCAALVGLVIFTRTTMGWVELCFYPILSFVILHSAFTPYKDKKSKKAEDCLISTVVLQMKLMKEQLEIYL